VRQLGEETKGRRKSGIDWVKLPRLGGIVRFQCFECSHEDGAHKQQTCCHHKSSSLFCANVESSMVTSALILSGAAE
jgi:hypothetical protein